MKIIVKKNDAGQRLDKYLKQKMKKVSRSQIKKIIQQNLVLVNTKTAPVHQFLKDQDVIEVKELAIIEPPAEKEKQQPETKFIEPKIIYENQDFLILDKPVGLLVHPTAKGEVNTLANYLVTKYPEIKSVGEGVYRAGIIHRLDKDVSGIMVVPKNQKTYQYLKEQFKKREIKKEYITLVYGHLEQETGTVDLPIGRNQEGQYVAHPRQGNQKFQDSDKIAKTKYWVLEYIKDYSLLKIQILTGRTHQIRVHLSAIGHPILGDQIYKPKKKFFHFLRRKIKIVAPGRIILHSKKIGFYDLNRKWVEFESMLPESISNFINEQKS